MELLNVILGAIGIILLTVWMIYNKFIKIGNMCQESWSGIETELKRRYDLIPNLVETVRGYAKYEQSVLENVTRMRTLAVGSTGSPQSQAKDENALVGSLKSLFAVAEKYPDLKADQNFLKLQEELVNTEDRIQAARRFYNGNVRDFNNHVQMFPSNMFASLWNFQVKEYFEIEATVERAKPDVSFEANQK